MTAFWIILGVHAFLCLLILFLVFPAFRRHPERQRMTGIRVAHRGLHDLTPSCPENSLPAFALAAEKGYAIENDIHLTKDGEVVVFHDDDLSRMCGVEGKIEEKTLSELKELRLQDTDERIPTLKECLDTVAGRVPLLIEFKSFSFKGAEELCVKANAILLEYEGTYWIQSFFPWVPRWYKKHRPDICRGQLASGFYKEKFPLPVVGMLVFNLFGRPDFVSYDINCPRNFFFRLCVLLGAHPAGWTVRSADALKETEGKYRFRTAIFELFLPDGPERRS